MLKITALVMILLTTVACGSDGDTEQNGVGGSAGGGATNNGGASGSAAGARACIDIQADYAKTFAVAEVCDPEAAANECTKVQNNSPGCGCPKLVNPANAAAIISLRELTSEFAAAGCDLNACPEISACSPTDEMGCDPAGVCGGR